MRVEDEARTLTSGRILRPSLRALRLSCGRVAARRRSGDWDEPLRVLFAAATDIGAFPGASASQIPLAEAAWASWSLSSVRHYQIGTSHRSTTAL